MLSIDQYHHKVDKADSIQFTVANQNVGLTRAEIDWRTAWPFAGKARTIKLNAANGWTDTLALNGTVVGYAVYTVNVYFPNGFNAESWAAIDPDMEINP